MRIKCDFSRNFFAPPVTQKDGELHRLRNIYVRKRMQQHINRILSDFGNAMGLEGLCLDENGYCCLSFDDVILNIEAVGDSSLVLLYSNLGILPDDVAPGIYRKLLEANYFFHGTGGATLGLDPDVGGVAMTRVLDISGMEVLDWEAAIKAFVDAAEICALLLTPDAAQDESIVAPSILHNHLIG